MDVELIVTEGKSKGRAIRLPPTLFLIGRGRRCHLRPHCLLVSKLHCAIAVWRGKVLIRDLHSANGTYLNGQRIAEEAAAFEGDLLRVGTLEFRFHITPTPAAPPCAAPHGHAADLQWLAAEPGDSAVLDEACRTHVLRFDSEEPDIDIEPTELSDDPSEFTSPFEKLGSGELSGGEYLRDYLKQRK